MALTPTISKNLSTSALVPLAQSKLRLGTADFWRECFWRNSKCLGGTWRKHQPEPAPLARAGAIFLQIQNCCHYTKKFELISSGTLNEARAERVVALN